MKKLAVLLLMPLVLSATSITSIQDTLKYPDGTLASGIVVISWSAFFTTGGVPIAAGEMRANVLAGVLDIALEPNDTATPAGGHYSVTYRLNRGVYAQTWVVPTSATSLNISDVVVLTTPTAATTAINLNQISGTGMVKGDLLAFGTSWSRLPAGLSSLCLQTDPSQVLGLKWAACGSNSPLVVSKTLLKSGGPGTNIFGSTWSANDKILFSRWAASPSPARWEIYSINPNGTGEACVTCGMNFGTSPDVSSGCGMFHPDGDHLIFVHQKAGSTVTQKCTAGVGYDLWATDWPVVNGPWKVQEPVIGALWPRFNQTGTRLFWTAMIGLPDATYPWGEYQVLVASFTKANPAVVTVTDTFVLGAGGLEPGVNWDDNHYAYVTVAYGTGATQWLHNIWRVNMDDHSHTALTSSYEVEADESATRIPFAPYVAFSSSREFTPTIFGADGHKIGNVWAMSNAGYLSGLRKITDCSTATDPMYTAGVSTNCIVRGVSPDGKKLLVQRNNSSVTDIWVVELQW